MNARGNLHPRYARDSRLNRLYQRLLDERRRLLADVGDCTARLEAPREPVDLLDMACWEREADTASQVVSQELVKLSQVETALRKMETGTYGVCEACGRNIGAARLRALPFALRCRPCQERAEAESAAARPEPAASHSVEESDIPVLLSEDPLERQDGVAENAVLDSPETGAPEGDD